jgi:hypothetical protein
MVRATRAIVTVCLLVGVAGFVVAQAQSRKDTARVRQQLIGSYKLMSYDNYAVDGTVTKSPYTVGQISYDAAGRMSAQLMRENRQKLSSPATEAERAAAYSGFISYFGHYDLDVDKGTVTHHVEGAVSPNMVGNGLVRHFEFSPDGKSLFLSVKDGERVAGKLRWDRYPKED